MIQTRFDKMNTPCDDCILWFTCLFYYGVQCAQCFCDVPDELEFLADCMVMTVNGCMHAQQYLEIEEIKKTGYAGPSPAILAAMPPSQQKMCTTSTPGGGSGSGGGGGVPASTFGAAAAGAGGAAAAAQARPQQAQQHSQPAWSQQPAFQAPPMQQSMPQAQTQAAQPPIQVACGTCQQVFGSPSYGVTVACPFCGTHNNVPPPTAVPMGSPMMMGGGMGGMYGGQPRYGQQNMYGQSQQQQRGRPGMGTVAAGGAGFLGGMIIADALF